MSEAELVRLAIDGGIATITLDSPHNRNALSSRLVTELTDRLRTADGNAGVHVLVLTHTGTTFCSGADLSEARGGSSSENAARLLTLIRAIVDAGKPVIARIDGNARAGGVGLIGACDIAVAGPRCSFALTEVRLGLAPAVVSVVLLPRIDARAAARYYLTGETFDSTEALRIGLVTIAAADTDAAVAAVAAQLLLGSPQGLAESKRLTTAPVRAAIERDGDRMVELSARLFASDEAREGMVAFLERRPPALGPLIQTVRTEDIIRAVTSEAWESHQPSRAPSGASPAVALRQTLLWASRRRWIKRAVTAAPVTRGVVRRFVAGEGIEDAVRVARELDAEGMLVSLDHLGEDTRDAPTARAAVDAYRSLARRLADEGLAASAEMSVKLSAVGQALDEAMALDNARLICAAARSAGTTVTIDMEDHSTTDSTLRLVTRLREDFPTTGAVLQASLRRSEDDCRALGVPGSRVRLCKGAYQEPPSLAWQRRGDIRAAYVRCLRVLIAGGALPMAATHDPKLIEATGRLVAAMRRPGFAHEYQLLYGIRPDEQRRLVSAGETVRVYVPFGVQWYGYLMRRMAERPANTALFLRALMSRN